ncbi:MAG: L-2-hydroxyglutarate oxidase [Syntrophobacterales bacterium]|nr:L-2-hydroxyglutarate oxidase [Syntrophobacterales bacterium]
MRRAEVLIVGGGIVGLTVARELIRRGYEEIIVIEKERKLGAHASGRNSGVLHAGVYYTPESLKAKSCLRGNRLLKDYCKERGIPILETGKVIVASSGNELPCLEELFKRAQANGATVEWVDEKELSKIEPSAKTVEKAIYVRETASVDPKLVLEALGRDVENSMKARVLLDCTFRGLKGSSVAVTSQGEIRFERFINAAGAFSDKVAHAFGLAGEYRLLPFKGIYWKLRNDHPLTLSIRGHIYPAPDLRYPFLGVHFSRNVHGEVFVGPTAIPAFGREHYGKIRGIDGEAPLILARNAALLVSNKSFREMGFKELLKYFRPFFYRDAKRLVKDLQPEALEPSHKVGIRPQLVNIRKKKLEMDFMVIQDGTSIHVLNPISPAFTASMDLAERIVSVW